jgi:hypothetical protein
MRRRVECAARGAVCFTRGCERKTLRNRMERSSRGAIGKALWGRGFGESSTIVLNNPKLSALMASEKTKASIVAQLWLISDDSF